MRDDIEGQRMTFTVKTAFACISTIIGGVKRRRITRIRSRLRRVQRGCVTRIGTVVCRLKCRCIACISASQWVFCGAASVR